MLRESIPPEVDAGGPRRRRFKETIALFLGISPSGTKDETVKVGNGNSDVVSSVDGGGTISVGNGNGDLVSISYSSGTTRSLGDGAGDVVNDAGANDTITLGNGADTVTAGENSMITVGNGADTVTAGAGSTSRRPLPNRLRPTIAKNSAVPGAATAHQAENR
jgi:hypothetical protein